MPVRLDLHKVVLVHKDDCYEASVAPGFIDLEGGNFQIDGTPIDYCLSIETDGGFVAAWLTPEELAQVADMLNLVDAIAAPVDATDQKEPANTG